MTGQPDDHYTNTEADAAAFEAAHAYVPSEREWAEEQGYDPHDDTLMPRGRP